MQPHNAPLAVTNDALILGVDIMDGKLRAMFTVDRSRVPGMVRQFNRVHRTAMADFPGRVSDDPGSLAHGFLIDSLDENVKPDTDSILMSAIYFLDKYGTPKDLIGPTLIRADGDGVGCTPMDVGKFREAVGVTVH